MISPVFSTKKKRRNLGEIGKYPILNLGILIIWQCPFKLCHELNWELMIVGVVEAGGHDVGLD